MAAALDSTQGLVASVIEIFFVDLLLSADNAVVIAPDGALDSVFRFHTCLRLTRAADEIFVQAL